MKINEIDGSAFKRFFYPTNLMIHKPGAIYNKTISKFGTRNNKTRVVYSFEEIYSNLYIDTCKILGKNTTDRLWYKIGKEIAIRYLLFLNKEKIRKCKVEIILDYIFKNIEASGFNFCKKFYYIQKKRQFLCIGKNSLICRKTGSGSISAGIASGLLSFITNKNIEMEAICNNCPMNCKIISNNSKSTLIPNIEDLRSSKNYNKFNFNKTNLPLTNFNSMPDLIKFNKIKINKKENKILFYGKTILVAEIGLGELFIKNYKEINMEKFFRHSIITSSEKIFKEINKNKTKEEKIKQLKTIISAFGWGIPYLKETNNKIILNLINPPFTKYIFSYKTYIINGFLNEIYKKKFRIHKNFRINRIEFY